MSSRRRDATSLQEQSPRTNDSFHTLITTAFAPSSLPPFMDVAARTERLYMNGNHHPTSLHTVALRCTSIGNHHSHQATLVAARAEQRSGCYHFVAPLLCCTPMCGCLSMPETMSDRLWTTYVLRRCRLCWQAQAGTHATANGTRHRHDPRKCTGPHTQQFPSTAPSSPPMCLPHAHEYMAHASVAP